MKNLKLLALDYMNPNQQVVYSLLPIGESGQNNLKRKDLKNMGFNDRGARIITKSLLPFAPVVATNGYFIANNVGEIDCYIKYMQNRIASELEVIAYLLMHKEKMVKENEF